MLDTMLTVDRGLEVAERASFSMTEDEFRRFYDATVHRLRAYLTRLCGDATLADDLSQEAYCRFLGVDAPPADDDGRRRYLFRIGTNLFHDHHRRSRREQALDPIHEPADAGTESRLQVSRDVRLALGAVSARQRAMLWLAYVEGLQHREIAQVLGLSALSIRPLLFRARRRLSQELRRRGLEAAAFAGEAS